VSVAHTRPVGLVGLGLVGTALAERLLTSGVAVRGYDLDRSRVAALEAAGGSGATCIAETCPPGGTLILSLPDSDAVRTVVDEILAAPERPGCLIDTTTGDPDAVDVLAADLNASGIACIDATISGSSEQLREGEAVLMVGGEDEHIGRCCPLLELLSPTVIHLGPAGSGSRAKLASNLVLGLNRLALAEGLHLAESLGLDAQRFLDLLVQTPAYSRQMDTKGPKMVAGDYAPAARLRQHRKDVGLILAAARRAGVELPLSTVHEALLQAAIDAGDGDLDNSAVLRQLRRASGQAT
jgi:3-hydroxyisobutyrate dehydrogenase-like beta-hydroxyacid dehydrogenase